MTYVFSEFFMKKSCETVPFLCISAISLLVLKAHVAQASDVLSLQEKHKVIITDARSEAMLKDKKRTPLKPRGELNFRPGTERSIGMVELWAPLAQDPDKGRVLYGDIRFMDDNQDNNEFNLGLGYRQIINGVPVLDDVVIGVHGWFDRRRTERDSYFNQATIGGELKGHDLDILANGYIPLSSDKVHKDANPVASNLGFVGNQVLVNTAQTVVEEPLAGLDLEIGYKVPFFEHKVDAIRAYAGGYHFWGDRAEDVSGYRTRFQIDVTSDISLGARYQHDDVRGSQSFLDLTFRFPQGSKKKYQEEGLYARLDESPERDIDIVSNEAMTDDGVNKKLVDATTGDVVEIFHVDNTGGAGDGTAENPFNTLAAAEAAAGANDIIYVNRGNGTSAGQNAGVTLSATNQVLAGSGAPLVFDSSRFTTSNGNAIANITLQSSGLAPVITNIGGDGVTVTGENALITGVTIDSAAQNGVDATNVGALTIKNTTITGSTENGIHADSTGVAGDFILSNNTITNNTEDGIQVDIRGASNVNFSATNNVLDNNEFSSLFVVSHDSSVMMAVIKENMITDTNDGDTAVANSGRGVWARAEETANLSVDISDNTILRTRGEAIKVEGRSATGVQISGSVSNNVITDVYAATGGAVLNLGVQIEAQSNATIGGVNNRFVFSNNKITNTSEDGVKAWGNGGSVYVDMANNTVTGGDDGLEARVEGAGFVDAVIRNNISYGHTEVGIQIDGKDSSGTLLAQVYGNELYNNNKGLQLGVIDGLGGSVGTVAAPIHVYNNNVYDNTGYGVHVTLAPSATANSTGNAYYNITGNTISNSVRGIRADLEDQMVAELSISNNTISSSSLRAIRFSVGDTTNLTSTISGNTITGTTNHGILSIGTDSSVQNLTVSSNTITSAGEDGVEINAEDTSVVTGSIVGNTITGSGHHGIFLRARDASGTIGTGGNPFLINSNIVTGNAQSGVTVLTAAGAAPIVNTSLAGNVITGNTIEGIEIDDFDSDTGTNNVSIDLGGGAFSSVGGNSIYDNAGVNVDYNADQATVLKAEGNWWGQDADPSTFDEASDADGQNEFVGNNATIDSSPRLASEPNQ